MSDKLYGPEFDAILDGPLPRTRVERKRREHLRRRRLLIIGTAVTIVVAAGLLGYLQLRTMLGI